MKLGLNKDIRKCKVIYQILRLYFGNKWKSKLPSLYLVCPTEPKNSFIIYDPKHCSYIYEWCRVYLWSEGCRPDGAPAEQWSRPKDIPDRQSDVKRSIRSP